MKKKIKKIARKALGALGIQVALIPRQKKHEVVITGKVGKFNLLMNADHTIVQNIRNFPSYSANLPRLVQLVKEKYQDAGLIDVGANIGDGVALVRTQVDCPIICIEGDPEYFSLLKKNLEQFKRVLALNNFLGENESNASVETFKSDGTLRIQDKGNNDGQTGDSVAITTIDSLSSTYEQAFSKIKVLKIDTDGYDLKIIRGSKEFIKKNKPALFFEYDRVYLDALNEDGLSIYSFLKDLGYSSILFYDNYGRFLISVSIEQIKEIEQLDAYIAGKTGAFPYYDLCVFHKDDSDIAQQLIDKEVSINNR